MPTPDPGAPKGRPTPKAPQNQKAVTLPGPLITAFPVGLEVSGGVHNQLGAVLVCDYDLPGASRLRMILKLDFVDTITEAMLKGKEIAQAAGANGGLAVVESKIWTPDGGDG